MILFYFKLLQANWRGGKGGTFSMVCYIVATLLQTAPGNT